METEVMNQILSSVHYSKKESKVKTRVENEKTDLTDQITINCDNMTNENSEIEDDSRTDF